MRAATLPPVLTLSAAVVTVRASAVARPLLRYLERLSAHEAALTRLGAWRAQVYADLVPRVPSALLRRRGELLTRVVADVDARVDGLLRGRLPAAAAVAPLLAVAAAASLLLPGAVPALAGGLLLAALGGPALAAWQAHREEQLCAAARARLADAVLETVEGVEELGGAGALRVPDRAGRDLARTEARAARTAGLAAGLVHLGHGVALVGTALAAATAAGAGRLGAEAAAVLLLVLLPLAEPLLGLPDAAVASRRATAARARLQALAAHEPPAAEPARPLPVPARADLRVRGLSAGWDPQRPPALTGLDLDLPAGARVAVLGASGGGKSTLAAVLVRLLDPRAGSVRLGGVDVRDLRGDDVRGRVALVSDDTAHVFASTVRENLRLARPGASDAQLRAALRRVRLGTWLERLPAGLDTWLGEGGGTLSGGERRRLVTARALLGEPDVLVLDEPTEGLDEATARALVGDLLDAAAGRSVLLLTHREEGLAQVDEVLRLHGGRLLPAAAGARAA